MNINLKQTEIVNALKQYVSKQGISLENKTVNITFTAGRKDTGLSADIVIEDTPGLPDFDLGVADTGAPKAVLSVVKNAVASIDLGVKTAGVSGSTPTAAVLDSAEVVTDEKKEDPPFEVEAEEERPLGTVMGDPAAEVKPATTSLFS